MPSKTSNRVTRRWLRKARQPLNTIAVNVWDDSPPGAPIVIEGNLPTWVSRAAVHQWLADAAIKGGYEIEWYDWEGLDPGGEQRFKVRHPVMTTYDDAVDQKEHRRYLVELVQFFAPLVYTFWDEGRPVATFSLYVYSES
jgi:hypothetical protein